MKHWTYKLSRENGQGRGSWNPENYFVFSQTSTVLDLWDGSIKTEFDSLFLQQKGQTFWFMTLSNACFKYFPLKEQCPLLSTCHPGKSLPGLVFFGIKSHGTLFQLLSLFLRCSCFFPVICFLNLFNWRLITILQWFLPYMT